jgi:hypothetical protein
MRNDPIKVSFNDIIINIIARVSRYVQRFALTGFHIAYNASFALENALVARIPNCFDELGVT